MTENITPRCGDIVRITYGAVWAPEDAARLALRNGCRHEAIETTRKPRPDAAYVDCS